jgi:DNA-binding NarL/FixJ family response regulator
MQIKTILLVDAHKILRDGIKSLLEDRLNYLVIAQAGTAEDALEMLKTVEVDLIISDMNMGAMEEINYIKQLMSHHSHTPVLILTSIDKPEQIRSCIQAGVKSYLLKSCGKEELLQAIEAIKKEQTYFIDTVTRIVMRDLAKAHPWKSTHKKHIPLTNRELSILELILKEYTNQEIAHKLFISVRTVDAHRRNMLEKTGARNTAGLVKFALEHKLFKDL